MLTLWRALYGGLKPEEAKQLKLLDEQNIRPKKLTVDLSLDIAMLKELASGRRPSLSLNSTVPPAAAGSQLSAGRFRFQDRELPGTGRNQTLLRKLLTLPNQVRTRTQPVRSLRHAQTLPQNQLHRLALKFSRKSAS